MTDLTSGDLIDETTITDAGTTTSAGPIADTLQAFIGAGATPQEATLALADWSNGYLKSTSSS